MSTPTISATLGQLADAEPALGRLASEKLPFQVSYRIAKLARAVAVETKHFHDARNALVREYGQAKSGGADEMHVTPDMPNWSDFVTKVVELAAVEATIPLWPIDLTTVEGLTISAGDLLLLGPLVTLEAEGQA